MNCPVYLLINLVVQHFKTYNWPPVSVCINLIAFGSCNFEKYIILLIRSDLAENKIEFLTVL
jgi:hypothetical protein